MRTQRRILTVVASAGLLFAAAGPAAAHVTVSSADAAPGGYGKLVFRVPTESETASTTKVQVTMPADTPFASVSPKPHPGWQVNVNEAKLPEPVQVGDLTLTDAVRTVTWTAHPGMGVPPEMFDEFELSVGPFPDEPTTLTFPTVQTYSDGEAVRWNQPTPPSGAEPEHPAPTLELTDEGTSSGQDSETETEAAVTADEPVGDASSQQSTDGGDSDMVARILGAGGLIAGVAALVVVLLRRRREAGG